jgi:TetR/AcrR family transcriptional regulator, repressor for uid operon
MPRTVNPDRQEARRQEILNAAQACFERKGFHATTMAEICAAAEISPGGLYRYFPSKVHIIAGMAEGERMAIQAAFAEVAQSDDVLLGLAQLCDHFAESYSDARHAALAAELMAEALRNPEFAALARATQQGVTREVANILEIGQRAGQIDAALDPEAAAAVLLAAADGLGLRLAFVKDLSARQAADALRSLILRYLRPDGSPAAGPGVA